MEIALRVAIIVLTIIVGLCVGSFLNVIIYRVPNGMSIAKPASHCPKCKNPIKWYDNVPILSYIILGGKCRHCKGKISLRYPSVELLNGILWFVSLTLFTNVIVPSFACNWIKFGVSIVTCSTLICIFFSDYDNMEIPEVFHLILLLCGLVYLIDNPTFDNILIKVIGFIASGFLFYIVNLIYKAIHKRDGIGFGDVELVAVAGLILGIYQMLFALLIACVGGGIILLILSAIKKEKGREYPFAVFLTIGITISLFVGEYVINWYLNILR